MPQLNAVSGMPACLSSTSPRHKTRPPRPPNSRNVLRHETQTFGAPLLFAHLHAYTPRESPVTERWRGCPIKLTSFCNCFSSQNCPCPFDEMQQVGGLEKGQEDPPHTVSSPCSSAKRFSGAPNLEIKAVVAVAV
ncbi:unnamed protein product, partial [Ectocarpus fasciculatus]